MQKTIGVEAHYALEFLSEKFDKMSEEEKLKTIIHELMHIPQAFGGGFRHHDHVCDKNINACFKDYLQKKRDVEDRDVLGLRELKWKNQDNFKQVQDIRKNAEKSFFHF